MTTATEFSPESRAALKYVTHFIVLGLWVSAGVLFALGQLFAEHGLGVSLNYWLWLAGFTAVSSFFVRFARSATAVLAIHAGLALALNLIPTTMPFGLLRAGYDLLLTRS